MVQFVGLYYAAIENENMQYHRQGISWPQRGHKGPEKDQHRVWQKLGGQKTPLYLKGRHHWAQLTDATWGRETSVTRPFHVSR